MYVKSLGSTASIVILVAFFCQLSCDLAGNIWLSDWSQDMESTSNNTMDPNERVGVYGGIGAAQSEYLTFFVISIFHLKHITCKLFSTKVVFLEFSQFC